MSSQFSLSTAPAVTNQDLNQARGAQALRVLKNEKGDPAKIDKAAHDFESILLGEWLEKAEKSFATVPGSDQSPDEDPGHDQFQSLSCEFLAKAMSSNGGIGIAKMISKNLMATEAARARSEHKGDQSNQPEKPPTLSHALRANESYDLPRR